MMALKDLLVEVKYKSTCGGGGGDYLPLGTHTVKVKFTDSLRKVKKHITESLDVQGKLQYKGRNLEDYLQRKLADIMEEESLLHLITDSRPKELTQYDIEVRILKDSETRIEKIKVVRITTINKLRYKIQNNFGIPLEEQSIVQLDQQNDTEIQCQLGTNVMQLKQPIILLVKFSGSPPKQTYKRTLSRRNDISRGTPYDTRSLGKRKAYGSSSIHPKVLPKIKEKPEREEHQNQCSVPVQEVTFTAMHELGKNLEGLKVDKTKGLMITCMRSEEETDKIEITSKLVNRSKCKLD